MGPGEVNYPASLDDEVSLFEVANSAATTLTQDAASDADTLHVADTAKFPNSGSLLINTEFHTYTGKTATTFTGVVGGREDTALSSHTSGASVRQVISAAHHTVLKQAILELQKKLGAGAGEPTADSYLAGGPTGSSWQPLPISPTGPVGPQGPQGVTGAAVTKLYANSTLVGSSGELDLVDAGNVTVTPGLNSVQVALPRGPQGAQGPQGIPGPPMGGAIFTPIDQGGELDQAANSQLVITHVCPSGSYAVSTMYSVVVGSSRFITQETVLNDRVATVTFTRSSASVDNSTITSRCICLYGTKY